MDGPDSRPTLPACLNGHKGHPHKLRTKLHKKCETTCNGMPFSHHPFILDKWQENKGFVCKKKVSSVSSDRT